MKKLLRFLFYTLLSIAEWAFDEEKRSLLWHFRDCYSMRGEK